MEKELRHLSPQAMCEVAQYQMKDFESCGYQKQNKTKKREVTVVLGIFPSY